MEHLYPIDPIDAYVGERLRQCRIISGLSQQKLGTLEGISFQQIQKYERGTNRMSISRLVHFSRILNVPMTWFLDDLPTENVSGNGQASHKSDDGHYRRETLDLVRAYYLITNPEQRRAFGQILKSFSEKMV